jgi:hypothetical protein
MADTPDDSDSPAAVAERVRKELAATEELPVERTASRWIGEAQAVAGDAASDELTGTVVRERLDHVRELLAHVDGTGDERADEHVERARTLASRASSTE